MFKILLLLLTNFKFLYIYNFYMFAFLLLSLSTIIKSEKTKIVSEFFGNEYPDTSGIIFYLW